jgi:hypothetical protein
MGQSNLDFVGLMDNHLRLTGAGAYQNAASMPYYGEGSNSSKDNQSNFRREFDIAKDPRHGQEFWLPTSREQANRAMTLGLVPTSWEKAKYPHHLPAAGNLTTTGFDPLTWKPNYPNPAFLEMTPHIGEPNG